MYTRLGKSVNGWVTQGYPPSPFPFPPSPFPFPLSPSTPHPLRTNSLGVLPVSRLKWRVR